VVQVTSPRKGRTTKGTGRYKDLGNVYNIEVYGTHNYFAVSSTVRDMINPKPGIPIFVYNCQKIGKRAWYCGSPMQHNFGEELPKGVIIADLKTHKIKPVPIKSARIKTLVQFDTVPKKWPKNAYVKLTTSEATEDLPDCVVRTATKVEQQNITEEIDLDDVTIGLPEFCATRGLSEPDQKRCVKYITKVSTDIKQKGE
jgi:hypothetical protein